MFAMKHPHRQCFWKRSAVPLPPYNTPSGVSKASLGAFQVAEIMNFFPCILPPVPYCLPGSCYRIETVFSQLSERFSMKRVWARDMWHLASRLLRKVLAHTTAIILNRAQGHEPLRLAQLLAH